MRVLVAQIEDGEGHDDEHEQPGINQRTNQVEGDQQMVDENQSEDSFASGDEGSGNDVEQEERRHQPSTQVNVLLRKKLHSNSDPDAKSVLSDTVYSELTVNKKTAIDADLEQESVKNLCESDSEEEKSQEKLEESPTCLPESADNTSAYERCDRCMRNGRSCQGKRPCLNCQDRGQTCKEPTNLTIQWTKNHHPNRLIPKQNPTVRCHHCAYSKIRCDLVQPICGQCERRELICRPQGPIMRRGPRQKRRLKCQSCLEHQTVCDQVKPRCGACTKQKRQCKEQDQSQFADSIEHEQQLSNVKDKSHKCLYCAHKRLICDGNGSSTGESACSKCIEADRECKPYKEIIHRMGVPREEKCAPCLKNGYACNGNRPCNICIEKRSRCHPQGHRYSKGDEKCRYCLQHKRICVSRPCTVCIEKDVPCQFYEADGHTKRLYERRSKLQVFQSNESCCYCLSKKFKRDPCDQQTPCNHCKWRSGIWTCTY